MLKSKKEDDEDGGVGGNCFGGGLLIYVTDDISCKRLETTNLPGDVEGIFLELILRNSKILLFGGYKPRKPCISYFLNHIGIQLDKFIPIYDHLLLLGDFNSEVSENELKNFYETYNFTNLINKKTCYKNPNSITFSLKQ